MIQSILSEWYKTLFALLALLLLLLCVLINVPHRDTSVTNLAIILARMMSGHRCFVAELPTLAGRRPVSTRTNQCALVKRNEQEQRAIRLVILVYGGPGRIVFCYKCVAIVQTEELPARRDKIAPNKTNI